jgi:hypothetical protein
MERALLRAAASTLLCQHWKPIHAAEKLAQEKNIPLYDAIAFVALAKQQRRRDDVCPTKQKYTLARD